MVLFPPCKINLGLNVISKRPDNFHNLETVFFPLPLTDVLEAVPSDDGQFSLTFSGLPIPGEPGNNICIKAYELLKADFGIPAVKMHLHKVIPMGAGLGGGSSDGTFALKLFNSLFDLDLDYLQLVDYASRLGSDCAFFVDPKPAFASGRGEVLEEIPLSLSEYQVALVIPPVHVSTAMAFQGICPKEAVWSLRNLHLLPVEEWKGLVVNDFEESVFRQFPEIAEMKSQLYAHGAVYASMSGSGSACFGIFPKDSDVKLASWRAGELVSWRAGELVSW
jgi:4-diphosphocytidyl-2-C-methyl-D-erythritol kinase